MPSSGASAARPIRPRVCSSSVTTTWTRSGVSPTLIGKNVSTLFASAPVATRLAAAESSLEQPAKTSKTAAISIRIAPLSFMSSL